jgi:hypothetical protein
MRALYIAGVSVGAAGGQLFKPTEVARMSSAPRALQSRLLMLATGLLVAACGPKITSDRDSSIPIPAGATVEFEGGVLEGTNQLDPAVQNNIVHRRIQLAIVQQLTQKGYTMVDSTQEATFRVRYFVGVSSSTSMVTTTTGVGMMGPGMMGPGMWGPGWGMGWGMGGMGMGGMAVSNTTPVTTTDASFVVDLQEEKSGNTAWRGVWQGSPGSRAPSEQEINTTMARIFNTLPRVPK